ncbi:hypothetical protein F4677DRAFT_417294 [Hypoxylon crocopeplum]|nr:hypothetical protein F4677DRAFT_417294 [Hypoxylon crocopeplum]
MCIISQGGTSYSSKMLVRDLRRLLLVVIPFLLLFYAAFRYLDRQPTFLYYRARDWTQHAFSTSHDLAGHQEKLGQGGFPPKDDSSNSPSETSDYDENEENGYTINKLSMFDSTDTHVELFSVSTPDKKYFRLRFDEKLGINPNIIPHPLLENTWIMVAQQYKPAGTTHTHFVEIACDAAFDESNSALRCLFPPITLPIAPTGPGKCSGELEYVNLNVGPHDARVFHGPLTPFAMYGSNSYETCFGQWMQDFQVLINWKSGVVDDVNANADMLGQEPVLEQEQGNFFRLGTELRRPPPYSPMEKNWFIFWGPDGQMYAHYDISPRRVFAKLSSDGSVGLDLAPLAAAAGDEQCMDKYMPKIESKHESIHQATNSLSITLCRRRDPSCSASGANTFLFTIFQHKTFREFHSVYEPYVMVFHQLPPFQVYGLSRKPLWIHGRERVGEEQSQMFYVTSVSWKTRGQKYRGYLDDVLFLGFGIEDQDSAGIDVLASDLLADLGFCLEV